MGMRGVAGEQCLDKEVGVGRVVDGDVAQVEA